MIGGLMEKDLFEILREGPTGERDALGRPIVDRFVVTARDGSPRHDGRMEQATTAEGEAFVVDRFRAFFPPGTDLRSGDEVRARGRVYTVEGSPSVERIPGFAAISNLAATLRVVGPVT